MALHTTNPGDVKRQMNLAPFAQWTATQQYNTDDLVVLSSGVWKSLQTSKNQSPAENTFWTKVVGGGGASTSFFFTANVTLSSADILALGVAAPGVGKVIVAAPGAGKCIIPMFGVATFHPVTTPYTLPAGVFITVTTEGLAGVSSFNGWMESAAADLLDATAETGTWLGASQGIAAGVEWPVYPPTAPAGKFVFTDIDNQALKLGNDRAGSYSVGDGTLSVTVTYVILTIATGALVVA